MLWFWLGSTIGFVLGLFWAGRVDCEGDQKC